jgi:hypothetical protein
MIAQMLRHELSLGYRAQMRLVAQRLMASHQLE